MEGNPGLEAAMSKIPIDEKHDPETAIFWASFATEPHKQRKHCPTVTFYENDEGEFFVIEDSPSTRMGPMMWDRIEDPREWLMKERIEWLDGYFGPRR